MKALIALYFVDKQAGQNYPLIAPSITNMLDEHPMKGKGEQDSRLLIPNLHNRIMDLALKVDNLLR